jgi:hypothetical protein
MLAQLIDQPEFTLPKYECSLIMFPVETGGDETFYPPIGLRLLMKTKYIVMAAIVGFSITGIAVAEDMSGNDQKVKVTFFEADKFSDVRDAYMPTEKGQAAYLDLIQQHIVAQAGKSIGDGQKLEVTVTNVDMAGDFEPWHQPGSDDIRIIKDIYPPRIDLSFKLIGADGKVFKEGARELRDLGFMMHLTLRRNEELNYEKELLNDWIRKDIQAAKAK